MQTNDVVAVEDVMSQAGAEAHGNCVKAVLHRVPSAETSLFSVNPGEVLAAHLHPETWDLFFGIAGEGRITYQDERRRGVAPLKPRSFCAIPPGYQHEVCNLSPSEPLSFLLIHAPWDGYQFVRTGAQSSSSASA